MTDWDWICYASEEIAARSAERSPLLGKDIDAIIRKHFHSGVTDRLTPQHEAVQRLLLLVAEEILMNSAYVYQEDEIEAAIDVLRKAVAPTAHKPQQVEVK